MINIDPKLIHERIEKAGLEWSAANAKATLLEECYKSELNSTIQKHLKNGAKSMSEAESKGRADQETVQYIHNMTNARKEANDAKVRYEAAKTWFEALRTKAATQRQEMKMVDGHQ